jgi:hypothetical protein
MRLAMAAKTSLFQLFKKTIYTTSSAIKRMRPSIEKMKG